ncbi:MAG: hypothetical protein K2X80_18450, partial [Pseudomonadaceae bacterium]|nr:hypothetical protein [Pseudomonadaceae bacterium]
VPMAALVVVLPTPPLPDVTTMILAKVLHPKCRLNGNFASQNVAWWLPCVPGKSLKNALNHALYATLKIGRSIR